MLRNRHVPLRRLVALVAFAAMAATTTLAAVGPSHTRCASAATAEPTHEPGAAGHHDRTASPDAQTPAVNTAPQPCDHCPVEHCALAAPCGASTVSLGTPGLPQAGSVETTGVLGASWQPAHSRSGRPPTPPPTSLL